MHGHDVMMERRDLNPQIKDFHRWILSKKMRHTKKIKRKREAWKSLRHNIVSSTKFPCFSELCGRKLSRINMSV